MLRHPRNMNQPRQPQSGYTTHNMLHWQACQTTRYQNLQSYEWPPTFHIRCSTTIRRSRRRNTDGQSVTKIFPPHLSAGTSRTLRIVQTSIPHSDIDGAFFHSQPSHGTHNQRYMTSWMVRKSVNLIRKSQYISYICEREKVWWNNYIGILFESLFYGFYKLLWLWKFPADFKVWCSHKVGFSKSLKQKIFVQPLPKFYLKVK